MSTTISDIPSQIKSQTPESKVKQKKKKKTPPKSQTYSRYLKNVQVDHVFLSIFGMILLPITFVSENILQSLILTAAMSYIFQIVLASMQKSSITPEGMLPKMLVSIVFIYSTISIINMGNSFYVRKTELATTQDDVDIEKTPIRLKDDDASKVVAIKTVKNWIGIGMIGVFLIFNLVVLFYRIPSFDWVLLFGGIILLILMLHVLNSKNYSIERRLIAGIICFVLIVFAIHMGWKSIVQYKKPIIQILKSVFQALIIFSLFGMILTFSSDLLYFFIFFILCIFFSWTYFSQLDQSPENKKVAPRLDQVTVTITQSKNRAN